MIGVVIILLGLALIISLERGLSGTSVVGDAMFILAGLSRATFANLQKRWQLPAMDVTAVVGIAGLVALVPAYLIVRGPDALMKLSPAMLVAQVSVQGLLSGVIAMIAFATSVRLLGAAQAATFPALVPGFALLIGLPLTGEALSMPQIFGLMALGLGLLTVLRAARTQ